MSINFSDAFDDEQLVPPEIYQVPSEIYQVPSDPNIPYVVPTLIHQIPLSDTLDENISAEAVLAYLQEYIFPNIQRMQKRLLFGIKSNLLLLFRQYYALHNLRIRVTIAEAEAIYTYILDNADTQHDVYPQPRRVELFKRVVALYLDENYNRIEEFKTLLHVFVSRGEGAKAKILYHVLRTLTSQKIRANSEQAKQVIATLRQLVLSSMTKETTEDMARIILQTLAEVNPDLDIELTRQLLLEAGSSDNEVFHIQRIILLYEIIIGELQTADESQIRLFALVFHLYLRENSYDSKISAVQKLIKLYTSYDMDAEAAFIKECLEKSSTQFLDNLVGIAIHMP